MQFEAVHNRQPEAMFKARLMFCLAMLFFFQKLLPLLYFGDSYEFAISNYNYSYVLAGSHSHELHFAVLALLMARLVPNLYFNASSFLIALILKIVIDRPKKTKNVQINTIVKNVPKEKVKQKAMGLIVFLVQFYLPICKFEWLFTPLVFFDVQFFMTFLF